MKQNLLKQAIILSLGIGMTVPTVTADTRPQRRPVTPPDPTAPLLRSRMPLSMRRAASPRFIPAGKGARPVEILGSEVSYDDTGIYSLTWQDSPLLSLVSSGPTASGGGALVGDTYYCISQIYGTMCSFASYNALTWERNFNYVLYDMACFAHDMTYDPVDDRIYGCFMKTNDEGTTDGYVWGVLDTENLSRQALADMDIALAAVAADGKGNIYALDYDGTLYSVAKNDGALTELAKTGLKSELATGGVIDPRSGLMYYITQTYDATPAVYSIAIPSGQTELIGSFTDYPQLRGMFFPTPLAPDGAPAQPTDLKLQFAYGGLSGIFNATIPTETYDGEPLEGDLQCEIRIDGEIASSFSTYPGQTLYEFLSVPAAGMHTFTVTVSNSAGTSPAAELTEWVGPDEFTKVANVVLAEAGDMVSLTWDAPVPVHGGYYDPDLLTYDVTRFPDNVKVATDALFPTYYGMLPQREEMMLWRFRVDAKYDGTVISSAESNSLRTGSDITPPFATSFDSSEEFDLFTVDDANGDGYRWQWYNQSYLGSSNCVGIKYNIEKAMDDWLISPGIKLEGGKTYKVSFLAYCAGRNYPERLEVMYGDAAAASAMTETLMPPTVISDEQSSAVRQAVMLTPQTDGTYYIGFHGISDAGMFFLYLDDFSISEATGKTPGAPTSLTAIPDPQGENKVNISFITPEVDENGDPLSEISHVKVTRSGTTIFTSENPGIGQRIEVTDTEASYGTNIYTIVCSNSEGEGVAATVQAYVGEDEPATLPGLTVTETETGKFHISWSVPTTGANGGYLNPENLTYSLYRVDLQTGNMTALHRGFTGTETDDTFTPDTPTLIAYTARAENPYGMGRWSTTRSLVTGPADTLPFAESAMGGYASHPLWFSEKIKGDSEWYLATAGVAPTCEAQDGDGGMFEFVGVNADDHARLASTAITATSADKPQVSFWYYAGVDNTLILEAAADNGEWQEVWNADLNGTSATGWTKAIVDLSALDITRTVRIAFHGVCHDIANSIYIDNNSTHRKLI